MARSTRLSTGSGSLTAGVIFELNALPAPSAVLSHFRGFKEVQVRIFLRKLNRTNLPQKGAHIEINQAETDKLSEPRSSGNSVHWG